MMAAFLLGAVVLAVGILLGYAIVRSTYAHILDKED